ncbi:MAG: FAD-dependent oxidoreductase [Balneolaceae bacterium]|nr:FAD-dependent oxidoreductase [Balneolaceae bacterium]
MVIGIIGAGLSGLTAGRILARSGHEVTIFEKSRGYGGRMATRYAGKGLGSNMDHGLSYFQVKSDPFKEFADELLDEKLIQPWGKKFAAFDGERFLESSPNISSGPFYTSTKGMNEIGKYLGRWVDVRTETKVGGLTYFGTNRSKKRSWMVNLTSSETFEADAVVIALPAPQAYGILGMARDETNTLKIIRQIDEVTYNQTFSLMVGYGSQEAPDWHGVICRNSTLDFVSNETLKRDTQECSIVLHASDSFTREYRNSDEDTISKKMLGELAEIAGGWAATPDWSQLHFWRYSSAKKVIDSPYLELEDEDAPLALIGDYLKGNTLDDAYCSAYNLANDWIEKFEK